MANYTLFSHEGLELSIDVQDEKRVAKISLSVEGMYIEKFLSGNELVTFYRATRHLISKTSSIEDETVSMDPDDLITRTLIRLVRNKISVEAVINAYRSLYPKASSYFENAYGEETASVARVKADVFIGLPQSDVDLFTIERIQNATGDFMEAMGFELETQDEPVFGSFYQRLKYLLNGEVKTEASEIYKKGKTALEMQFVSVPSAEATGKLAEAAASLITALGGIDEAAIRLGAILVVKVSKDGISMILAETVSPELSLLLDKNPQLLKNPNIVFDLISTMRIPEKPIEEGSTEVID